MGNILEILLDPTPQIPQRTNAYSTAPQPYNRSTYLSNSEPNPFRNVQNVAINPPRIRLPDNHFSRMENINVRQDFYNSNADQRNVSNLNTQSALCRRVIQNCSWSPKETEYHFETLEVSSSEYEKVQRLFYKTTNKSNHVIQKIVRVENPYLKGRFQLKQLELQRRFGSVEIRLLFHGTNATNIRDICQNNFDWRKRGTGTGHRFGQGVSFSPKAYYSSHYSDKKKHDKVMILAEVLISSTCEGSGDMVLPDFCYTKKSRRVVRCDTSIKPGGDVVVKYADDEFYPAYLIYFHAIRLFQNRNNHNKNIYV